jgi:hypothetical protein
MIQHRYWVIGGDYTCLGFKTLKDGAPEVVGPFEDEAEARAVWKRLSTQHSSSATVRFSIAAEQVRMPA